MTENKQHDSSTSPPVPFTIYTRLQKALLVLVVSIAATFSGFASNIYFPAIPQVASDLHVSTELVNLSVTTYMIFQGLSPTLWGALSDVYGRRITYICTFVVFFGACVGLAETKSSYAQLMVLRCVQSTGSASTVAIGAGVIGDITTREERGSYMGFFQAGLLMPVAVGPILGGAFADTLGWRPIFWFLAIYSGVFLVVLVVVLPETLRSIVGNGSIAPQRPWAKSPLAAVQRRRYLRQHGDSPEVQQVPDPAAQRKKIDILGTVRILVRLEVTFAVLFIGIFYTVWQMVLTALSTLFTMHYGLSEIETGLVFIANGAGCICGTLLTGKLLDYDYRRIKASFTGNPEDFPLERARLRLVWLYGGLQCASVVIFGWTIEKGVHMAVPIICLFVLGWTAISMQSIVSTFLVDVYPQKSASAMAALNLVRCLLGAGGAAIVMPCVNAMNVGWTFTLFMFIMLASFGLVAMQMVYGATWRKTRERKEAEKQNGAC